MSQICPAPPSDPSAEELLTDDSSYPPSILRKRPPVDQAVGEKRKPERRVRFREPEEVTEYECLRPASLTDPQANVCVYLDVLMMVTILEALANLGDHTKEVLTSKSQISAKAESVDDRSSSGLPVLLWLSFCAVLILAVSLYYTSMKQDVKVLEEFQSRLVIFCLQIRHVVQKCCTWFMRQ